MILELIHVGGGSSIFKTWAMHNSHDQMHPRTVSKSSAVQETPGYQQGTETVLGKLLARVRATLLVEMELGLDIYRMTEWRTITMHPI